MANSLNTITVDGVTYDAAEYAKTHTTTKANDELGKDAFLQLLVAQMKYQDPLDPQDNSQYIAELANFSALEQMTNVSSNLEKLSEVVNNIDTSVLVGQLSSMIGQGVTWNTKVAVPGDNGETVTRNEILTGLVRGINLNDGSDPIVVAQIGDNTYKVSISDITSVFGVDIMYDDGTEEGTGAGNSEQR